MGHYGRGYQSRARPTARPGRDQIAAWQDPSVQRRLLGLLFAVLSAGLGLIAVFSALEGGGAWVIALAAAALAVWMGDLARRSLMR